ncbi:Iron-sulfur cluster assembly protein CyaY [Buchnera aphidicola (Eriosoma grossulariae)]|uniref:iron donor protein CyaY n=1 Tax=Buchnera aphidicola TaxID=9 RepID=UPI00346486C0
MKNKQYHQLVDEIMLKIENCLDLYMNSHDIDYEINHNMLVIEFKNKNQIIINKQEFLQEIWVATKTTGYHFKYDNYNWICTKTNINFWVIIEKIFFLECNIKFFFNSNII